MSVPEFLTRIVSSIQNRQDSPSPSPSDMDELRMVEDLIRKQLGKVARDVRALSVYLSYSLCLIAPPPLPLSLIHI